jgi:hypothetical protein
MPDPARCRTALVPLLAVLALSAAACGGSSSSAATTPTTPTPTPTLVTEAFTGSIGQNGSAIHPFAVQSTGYTLLAGYTSLTPATQAALGLGIGAWDGTTSTCGLNLTQNDASKSGSTAVTGTASAGNYCIRVYDGGNIAAGVTVGYSVQVQHY